MDVIAHLTKEHRTAEGLLKRLADSEPGPARKKLIDELDDALSTHMRVEEQFLYPVVDRVMDHDTEKEAEVEHSLARQGLKKLHEMADEPGFGAAVDMLEAGIKHHVKEEEDEIFPTLRKKAGDELEAMDPDALEASVRAGTQTRDQLYEQARAADVEGRSKMSKAELAEAVHAQSS